MFYPKNMNTAARGWEYYPAAAGTYKVGQLLNAAGGMLTPITAASKTTPGYVCMAETTVAEGGTVPVQRIEKGGIYATTLSAESAGAVIGGKLEISAGGLQADGAAEGTFEVTWAEGTAAGCEVWGRFI